MPICTPCQPTHTAAQCDDSVHGRTGAGRRCYCQHKARGGAAPTGQAAPGPECEVPTTIDNQPRSVGATGHTHTTTVDRSRA